MKTLFINIASQHGLIAVVNEASVIAMHETHTKVSDAELVEIVEKLVPSYDALTHIACVVGPGGFTSLRVAVSLANIMADQLDIPLVEVHLSDLYRARVLRQAPAFAKAMVGTQDDSVLFWVHSTKKDQLFIRGGEYKKPTLITLDDLPEGDWCGELIDDHATLMQGDEVALQPTEDVLPAFLQSLEYEKQQIEPWYGRNW